MPILSDLELIELTHSFQQGTYSRKRALDLVAAATISIVTEPGDRMAGALAKSLGTQGLLALLIDGFEPSRVLKAVNQASAADYLADVFGDLPGTISDSRQRWLPRFSKQAIVNLFQRAKQLDLSLLLQGDDDWPIGLNDLEEGAPALIYVQGNYKLLGGLAKAVSIVGSRACTEYGVKVTTKLVSELAFHKRPTVSGGATGIDSQVHSHSLRNSLPTVAVMAGGLDRMYPSSNSKLFQTIARKGVLIAELAPGVAPTRWRFLQRNRLIAALTPTTVVVEAGIRSGSIRTAHNAIELDRELFAVPGPLTSASSAGTNSLIAEGKAKALIDTKLITSNVIEQARFQDGSALMVRAQDALRDLRQATVEQIAKAAGLTLFELNLALEELKARNQLTIVQDSSGSLHYALKYANRARIPSRSVQP
jgi:DNA processing protein